MEVNKHKGLANKARKIYNGRLRQSLESSNRGHFVAIEVESGDYFLGTLLLVNCELNMDFKRGKVKIKRLN